jgi:hypothetical protein
MLPLTRFPIPLMPNTRLWAGAAGHTQSRRVRTRGTAWRSILTSRPVPLHQVENTVGADEGYPFQS